MNKSFKLFLTLALFFAAFSSANAGEYTKEGDVLVLTDSNIHDAIKEHESIFITFYDPWLEFSRNTVNDIPTWVKAAKKDKIPVTFAKVDLYKEKEARKLHPIYAYPYSVLYVNGSSMDYMGEYDKVNVTKFIREKIDANQIRQVSTPAEVANVTDEKSVVLLFLGSKKHKDFPLFKALSRYYNDIGFLYAKSKSGLRDSYRVPKDTNFLVLKKHGEGKALFEGEANEANLRAFIERNRFAPSQPYDTKIIGKVFQEYTPALILLHTSSGSEELMEMIQEVGEKVRGNFMVITCSYDMPRVGKRFTEYLGATEDDLPTLRLVNPVRGSSPKKYFWDPNVEMTTENVVKFVEDFKAGKLRMNETGQPAPETNDGPVKVVVSSTYEQIIMDPTKHVFVDFYAEKCHHCKNMAPAWEEFAAAMASNPDVVIAKYDGYLNEREDLHLPSYPIMRLFKIGEKDSPIEYEGDRSAAHFQEWLNEKLGLKSEAKSSDKDAGKEKDSGKGKDKKGKDDKGKGKDEL